MVLVPPRQQATMAATRAMASFYFSLKKQLQRKKQIKGQINKIAITISVCSIFSRAADVELDEVSFRSVGRPGGIVWLRYLAVARRGSSKVWLQRLPYRVTQAGQGGGGPLSVAEMTETLLLDSDKPVLAKGSVCHTDGAKASPTRRILLADIGAQFADTLAAISWISVETKKTAVAAMKSFWPGHDVTANRLTNLPWPGSERFGKARWAAGRVV